MTRRERRIHYCMSLLGRFVDYTNRLSFLYTVNVYNKHFLYQSFSTDVVIYKTTSSSQLINLEDFTRYEKVVVEEYNEYSITQFVITSYITI